MVRCEIEGFCCIVCANPARRTGAHRMWETVRVQYALPHTDDRTILSPTECPGLEHLIGPATGNNASGSSTLYMKLKTRCVRPNQWQRHWVISAWQLLALKGGGGVSLSVVVPTVVLTPQHLRRNVVWCAAEGTCNVAGPETFLDTTQHAQRRRDVNQQQQQTAQCSHIHTHTHTRPPDTLTSIKPPWKKKKS